MKVKGEQDALQRCSKVAKSLTYHYSFVFVILFNLIPMLAARKKGKSIFTLIEFSLHFAQIAAKAVHEKRSRDISEQKSKSMMGKFRKCKDGRGA